MLILLYLKDKYTVNKVGEGLPLLTIIASEEEIQKFTFVFRPNKQLCLQVILIHRSVKMQK